MTVKHVTHNRDLGRARMSDKKLKIAIIGAGPAGYYTAEALVKAAPDRVEVDIIDRLPTPFGLIRAGVAPDHQSIKAVAKRYAETNAAEQVAFFGNVTLGSDISLSDLHNNYDAVVLSVGAPQDKKLGIPGEHLKGVYGSGEFVGWYNGHPDYVDLAPNLDIAAAVVIGNGNVAIDVARVLVKSPAEMAESDLADHAAKTIHASPLVQVTICGRRSALDISFTPKEIGELGHLALATTFTDSAQMPPEGAENSLESGTRKVVQHLRNFANSVVTPEKPRAVHFSFFSKPVEILGRTFVTAVRFERTEIKEGKAIGTGIFFDIPCGLVVACIGYKSAVLAGVPYDLAGGRFENNDGKIADGLYCAGWARRGPTGTIGTNKPDGNSVAALILADTLASDKLGRDGLAQLLQNRGVDVVTFTDWQKIEAAEIAAASPSAPRQKIARVEDMLRVVRT
jgi:adrenodoxin-NADP+ reductase